MGKSAAVGVGGVGDGRLGVGGNGLDAKMNDHSLLPAPSTSVVDKPGDVLANSPSRGAITRHGSRLLWWQ